MILITGATGNVGGPLAAQLYAQGQPVRVAVSSPQSVARLPHPALPWGVLDFENAETYAAALAGVDKIFLMRPPHMANVEKSIKPLMDYAAGAGVCHIVFLSLLGAEKNKVVPHAKIESLLKAGPATYTLLRAGFFMQNLSTTHRQDIVECDDIFIPAGRGKTAFVDTHDLAAVAALALTEPGHANKAYPLTGSVKALVRTALIRNPTMLTSMVGTVGVTDGAPAARLTRRLVELIESGYGLMACAPLTDEWRPA